MQRETGLGLNLEGMSGVKDNCSAKVSKRSLRRNEAARAVPRGRAGED